MENINYLKEQVALWKSRAEEYKNDFEEYQQQSMEYENEMEQEINELKKKNNDYLDELNYYKKKYRDIHRQSNEACANYQNEIEKMKKVNEQRRERERELEIINDELERKIRITNSTCQDVQVKYNQILEKNVYLQQELENKMELVITVQRIKDELKDSNIELAVLRSKLKAKKNNKIQYQTPSPAKSQSMFSTKYNGYNSEIDNDSKYRNDLLNDQKSYSNDIYSIRSNKQPLSPQLSRKPFYMVQEFLERAKNLEMKIANARNNIISTNTELQTKY